MTDPVELMIVDPGGFYVPSSGPMRSPVMPSFVQSRPVSLPIVERYSGDPFSAPIAFRPSTDLFVGEHLVPQMENWLSAPFSGSQYAPAVVPAGTPGYRKGNGARIPEPIPAGDPKTVNVGRPR